MKNIKLNEVIDKKRSNDEYICLSYNTNIYRKRMKNNIFHEEL